MNRREVRRLRERLREHRLGDFAGEEELDAAIKTELAKLPPEEAERFLRQFAEENGYAIP